MKNRTLIGIICIVLAVAVTFVVSPMVNKLAGGTVKVVTVTGEIDGGSEIAASNIKLVEVNKSAVPKGAVYSLKKAKGYYAKTKMYPGDIITSKKITKQANTAEDVFNTLNGTQVAVSFTIDTFASGLSGKLKNGDIISLIVTNKDTGITEIPPQLKYVRVITTTTAGGVDKDSVKTKEDGTSELPSTVTILATVEQARLIASMESKDVIQAALVYRGDKDNAQKFLDKQSEFLNSGSVGGANE